MVSVVEEGADRARVEEGVRIDAGRLEDGLGHGYEGALFKQGHKLLAHDAGHVGHRAGGHGGDDLGLQRPCLRLDNGLGAGLLFKGVGEHMVTLYVGVILQTP